MMSLHTGLKYQFNFFIIIKGLKRCQHNKSVIKSKKHPQKKCHQKQPKQPKHPNQPHQ